MLEGLVWDLGFNLSSHVADGTSTIFALKAQKDDPKVRETNTKLRDSIRNNGLTRSVVNHTLRNMVKFTIWGSIFYAVDSFLGVHDDIINLHHGFLYGYGTIGYYISLCNLATGLGMEKIHSVLSFPFEKTFGRTSEYKKTR